MTTTTTVHPATLNLFLTREISEAVSEADSHTRIPSQRPTPLIGRWADESFPLNSRQASEIVQEQAIQRQRSSVVFEDTEGNEVTYDEETAAAQADDEVSTTEYENSELAEKLSVAQGSSNDDISLGSPAHVSRCYRFDPYNIATGGVDVMYCCYCEQCSAMANAANQQQQPQMMSVPTDFPTADYISNAAAELLMEPVSHRGSGSYPPQPQMPSSHRLPLPERGAPRGLGASPDNMSMSSASYGTGDWDAPHQRPQRGFATHLTSGGVSHVAPTASGEGQNRQGPLLSSFMPPPPPPRIMTLVLEEESNRRASSIYYHILTRWYHHAIEAQEFFVPEDDSCPAPNKDLYSFDEWADRVSAWWYRHFEHMQKKQTRFVAPHRRM